MSNVKQVIVVRKDLHMRKGKIIAQCCHASMKVLLDRSFKYFSPGNKIDNREFLNYRLRVEKSPNKDPLCDWLEGLFTKVVVYCNSEEDLERVEKECGLIPHSTIIDSGLTEFNGIPTKTCIAIGPWYSDDIDEITGKFKLL